VVRYLKYVVTSSVSLQENSLIQTDTTGLGRPIVYLCLMWLPWYFQHQNKDLLYWKDTYFINFVFLFCCSIVDSLLEYTCSLISLFVHSVLVNFTFLTTQVLYWFEGYNVKNRCPSAWILLTDVWWCNQSGKIPRYKIIIVKIQ